jgi:hypothetical protein
MAGGASSPRGGRRGEVDGGWPGGGPSTLRPASGMSFGPGSLGASPSAFALGGKVPRYSLYASTCSGAAGLIAPSPSNRSTWADGPSSLTAITSPDLSSAMLV